jgi:hypothetical protein
MELIENTYYSVFNKTYGVRSSGDASRNKLFLDTVLSGKIYVELTLEWCASWKPIIGVEPIGEAISGFSGDSATSYGYRGYTGDKITNSTSSSYGDTFSTGDIIGVALDTGSGKLWFSKNGVWQGSGDPENGTGEAFTTSNCETVTISAYNINESVRLHNRDEQVFSTPTGFKAVNSAFVVHGTVSEKGVPLQRKINAYRRDTGEYIGTTESDESGVYSIYTSYSGAQNLMCIDSTGIYSDLLLSRIVPENA